MVILLTIVHILVCFFLVVVVLLQSGKAADLAGAFGGMGSQTAFGPRGAATVLSKATTFAAVAFMLTSLSLAIMGTRGGGTSSTVLERSAGKPVQSAPAKSGAPAAPQPSVSFPGAGGAQPGNSVPFPGPGTQPSAPAQPQTPPAKK